MRRSWDINRFLKVFVNVSLPKVYRILLYMWQGLDVLVRLWGGLPLSICNTQRKHMFPNQRYPWRNRETNRTEMAVWEMPNFRCMDYLCCPHPCHPRFFWRWQDATTLMGPEEKFYYGFVIHKLIFHQMYMFKLYASVFSVRCSLFTFHIVDKTCCIDIRLTRI